MCACWVQVDESGQPTAMPTQVALVCPRQQAPAPGQEITIDYGDKSNEQLLLNYGECICPALPCPALPCIFQQQDFAAHAICLLAVKWTPPAVCLIVIDAVDVIQAHCCGMASMLPY